MIKCRKFFPTRPEGAEALSPGQWTQAARPEGAEALSPGQWTQAARPERAEALSPGQRPGLSCSQTCRPVRAKALKLTRKFIKLLPLQGALLIGIIPRALPWAKSFCPFRACCLRPLPWAMSFWAFSPYLNRMRYLSIRVRLRAPFLAMAERKQAFSAYLA